MSIQAVADKAGVSIATVSRVFNAPDKVLPATRALVESVARELGYLPSASARTLRTQRSRVLGVVLPTLLNPTFAECLQGLAQAAAEAGHAIVPLTTGYDLDAEQRAVDQLLAREVEGMVLVISNPQTSAALARLQARQRPYVLAYNRHPAHCCVAVDNEAASAEAVAHLAALGHRRIAMVSGTLAQSDRSQQRHRGFLAGMAAAGLDAPPLIEVPFVEAAVDALRERLAAPGRPTALFCSNDLLAIRAVRAAHLAGLRVPQDLSVMGFDGIALGDELTPRLGTIEQPAADIGRRAAQLLMAALDGQRAPLPADSLLLPHRLRTGESCAPPPDMRSDEPTQPTTTKSRRRPAR
ncbi:MAG: LacI family DNA-binding transcriptional regulator [Pseudacidovorax sp.]|uniref:LacI family DNA-binding transcriptional regulator n=1 Tax=Pseudacidovorax sp. TaxID=1934311 RepID=UPI001B3E675F|nr:LacI family DNA-binding transcriptional regulator [Pseudacidovorax sp.]MBP6898315.1 LacI family DNA-binding transcriptional regulator [Pseudacidovorax sp.]